MSRFLRWFTADPLYSIGVLVLAVAIVGFWFVFAGLAVAGFRLLAGH